MYTHRDPAVALAAAMLPAIVLFSSSLLASVAATAPAADDCILDLAIVCLDDRVLVYVHWLGQRDKLNVVGDIVTVVRKRAAAVQQGTAQDRAKLQPPKGQASLGPAIDEYFDTHALRISLPWIFDDDIDLELDQEGIVCGRCRAVNGPL